MQSLPILIENNDSSRCESLALSLISKTVKASSKYIFCFLIFLEINERFLQFMDELQVKTEEELLSAQNHIFWRDLIAYSEESSKDEEGIKNERMPKKNMKDVHFSNTKNTFDLIKNLTNKIDFEGSNKTKMMKLLGVNKTPTQNEHKIEHKINIVKPEPPPLPIEFQESAFQASK